MPKISVKARTISFLLKSVASEINECDSDDNIDEHLDELNTDLFVLMAHRRSNFFFIPKSDDWNQNVLDNLDDERFRQMLRVNRQQFEFILSLIKDDDVFYNSQQFPVRLQLKITLFRLGSYGEGAAIRELATLYGIGDGGSTYKITNRVFKAILNLNTKRKCISWPDESERNAIMQETLSELPGCIGYLDSTEIKLAEAPINDSDLYFSRKKQYSIKAQLICGNKLRIRQVTVGYPGSVHDAKVFANCNVFKSPENFFSHPQWIAADSAYMLTNTVITPFRKNSKDLTIEMRENFNNIFSKYRVRIENCISLLKERFRSLKELKIRLRDEKKVKECCAWFIICCILHNILLDEIYDTPQLNEHVILPSEIIENNNKRNGICHYLKRVNE